MENKTNKTPLELKNSFLEIKTSGNYGKFCGYASVFNIKDSYNDIVMPNAFKKNLSKKNAKDIKMLWQHKHDKPIGVFEIIKEDSIGLYVEGKIGLNSEAGKEAYSMIKSNAVSGLSIGYLAKEFEFKNDGTRLLQEVELFEISVVTFPANNYSNITYCKSVGLENEIILKLGKLLDNLS